MNNIKMKKEDIMGLNGEKMLQSLKHLSQVDKMKQVEPMSYAPVSYTHLDVYKRQLSMCAEQISFQSFLSGIRQRAFLNYRDFL